MKYRGDADSWARSGSTTEKSIISDGDWYLLDALIQDIFLVKKGLVSQEFENNLMIRLKENCDGQECIDQLQNMLG